MIQRLLSRLADELILILRKVVEGASCDLLLTETNEQIRRLRANAASEIMVVFRRGVLHDRDEGRYGRLRLET